ncbi:MAG TPA: nucleoside recognition domain-containing protein [Alphaproteobacteria bacterium]|jgi:spore maturation protein SpmA
MNGLFLGIVLLAFGVTAWRQIAWVAAPGQPSPMELLGSGMIESAAGSVTLAIGLIGVMALFLGLMKVAEAGGLLVVIARLIRPLMARLFPDVPADHPAMGAMVLNMSANALGLGNAATPFGIRAMQELDKLNPHKGTATDAMVMFLVINTANITILPTSVIALRAAVGSADPAAVVPTTLFATIVATGVAIFCARALARFWPARADAPPVAMAQMQDEGFPAADVSSQATVDALGAQDTAGYPAWISYLFLAFVVALVPLTLFYGKAISPWIIPGIMAGILVYGAAKRVRVYEMFVEGAKDGFTIAVRIIPYLVAILVAVAMLRASGALDAIIGAVSPFTIKLGLPAEALPMALMRSLSGSGAYGIMVDALKDPAIGPDSYAGLLISTIQGSSETTFYVLAVYCGAVQVRRMRHAVVVGVIADVAAVFAAVAVCSYVAGRAAG